MITQHDRERITIRYALGDTFRAAASKEGFSDAALKKDRYRHPKLWHEAYVSIHTQITQSMELPKQLLNEGTLCLWYPSQIKDLHRLMSLIKRSEKGRRFWDATRDFRELHV